MIGRRGERGSGISVLSTRHDDDEIVSKYCYKSLDLVSLFNGISTFLGYLMPKPFS